MTDGTNDEQGDEFDDIEHDIEPLDEHETKMVEQDLSDLVEFESTFRPEGFRGVAVWCADCAEEHFYPWDMLRENLTSLLETGETPVHEPAFAPEPDRYVPWEYARGYVDAVRDLGVDQRIALDDCSRCGLHLTDHPRSSNFCPRCGTPLLAGRLREALSQLGLDEPTITAALRQVGLAGTT